MITSEQLKSIMPHASQYHCNLYAPWLSKYMAEYEINTDARKVCFIANVAHESGSLKYVRELADGSAYEGRKDLGNVKPGDGKKFRGRGLIQITGRANYAKCSMDLFGSEVVLLTHPEWLEKPERATQSACWFWKEHSLNQLTDRVNASIALGGENLKAFKAVVKRINGGYNGLIDRMAFYERARKIFWAEARAWAGKPLK